MITRRQALAATAAAALPLASAQRDATRAQAIPPGRILFVRNGDIWAWNPSGAAVLVEDGAASDPRWSPDATRVLFVRRGDGFSDLWLHPIDGSDETRVTTFEPAGLEPGSADYVAQAAWVDDPFWAASNRIAFACDAGTPSRVMALWVLDDLAAAPELAPTDLDEDHVSAISLDASGNLAAYTSRYTGRDGQFRTYVGMRDLRSGVTWSLASDDEGAFDPALPPEGRYVAFATRTNGIADLWLFDLDGGERTRITEQANAFKPCWSPDGTWLAYLRMVDRGFEAWALPIVDGEIAGTAVRLFAFDDIDASSGLSWSYL